MLRFGEGRPKVAKMARIVYPPVGHLRRGGGADGRREQKLSAISYRLSARVCAPRRRLTRRRLGARLREKNDAEIEARQGAGRRLAVGGGIWWILPVFSEVGQLGASADHVTHVTNLVEPHKLILRAER